MNKNLQTLFAVGLIGGLSLTTSLAEDNFVRDGKFENAGLFTSADSAWELSYRNPELGTATYEDGEAPEGAGFLRLAPLNSAPPQYLAVQQKLDPAPAAGHYKLKAWIRINDEYAAKMPLVSVGWRVPGESGEAGSASVSLSQDAQPGQWTLCESEFEIPENAEGTYVFLFTYGSMGHADFDGVSLERKGE